jgi:cell wall-associated NlpC family hydrolase
MTIAAAVLALAAASGPAAAPASAARTAPVLSTGSQGKVVRAVQRKLGLPADGVFGRRTARAVKRFQQRRGLPVTGRVDPATRRALRLSEPVAPPRTGGVQAEEETTFAAPPAAAAPAAGAALLEAARAALGRPYKAGAAGPDGFDCSGLVVWAGERVGLELPRSSFAQYKEGTPVAARAVQAGDLVFFDTGGEGASDVGIASSATTVISATTHGVREHPIGGPYWGAHYVGARRV